MHYFNDDAWFIGYYFAIIVLAYIFLNNFLEKLEKVKYAEFLIIVFALSQFVWKKWFVEADGNAIRIFIAGVFLFSLGGYIAKYNLFGNIKTVGLILVIFATYLLIFWSQYNVTQNSIQEYLAEGSEELFIQPIVHFGDNSFTTIIIGIAIFELFRRIRIPVNKIINYAGASSFFVYLMHDNQFAYRIWRTQDWLAVLHDHPLYFLFKISIWAVGTFLVGMAAYAIFNGFCKLFLKYKFIFLTNKSKEVENKGAED